MIPSSIQAWTRLTHGGGIWPAFCTARLFAFWERTSLRMRCGAPWETTQHSSTHNPEMGGVNANRAILDHEEQKPKDTCSPTFIIWVDSSEIISWDSIECPVGWISSHLQWRPIYKWILSFHLTGPVPCWGALRSLPRLTPECKPWS